MTLLSLLFAVASTGWTPIEGSTLPGLPEQGWRQARVAEAVDDFEAAVDSRGRLVVAVGKDDGRLAVRRWDPGLRRWEDLGSRRWSWGWPFAVSTDADDRVFVARKGRGGIAVRSLPGWGIAWRTPDVGKWVLKVGLDMPSRTVLVYEDRMEARPRVLASTAGKRWRRIGGRGVYPDSWGATEGRVAWFHVDYDDKGRGVHALWPSIEDERRPEGYFLTRDEDGPSWRSFDGGGRGLRLIQAGNGARLDVSGRMMLDAAHHYGDEVNSLRIAREDGLLAPPGEESLVLPHTTRSMQVFETDPPVIAFKDRGGSLYLAAWNGEQWWGLGHDRVADGGFGGPGQLDKLGIDLVSSSHVEVFLSDPSRGSVLLELTRQDEEWTRRELPPPSWGALYGSSVTGRLWSNQGPPQSIVAMVATTDGLTESSAPSRGFVRGEAALQPLSRVPACPRCEFDRAARAADGSVMASIWDEQTHMFRLDDGQWVAEVLPERLRGLDVAAMEAEGDSVWVVFSGAGGHIVARWASDTWTVLPGSGELLGEPEPLPQSIRKLRGIITSKRVAAVALVVREGQVHVGTEDSTPGMEGFQRVLVTSYDGAWSQQVLLTRPKRGTEIDIELASRQDGTPLAALRDGPNLWVLEGRDGVWRGLDGSEDGRVWTGEFYGFDLAEDPDGRVCVGFVASDVRYRRLGMLCHDRPG